MSGSDYVIVDKKDAKNIYYDMLDQCSKQAGKCDIDFKNLKDRF